MNELLNSLIESFDAFKAEATAQAEKGNKAAGARARKASLAIEKSLKAFRKASIEASK